MAFKSLGLTNKNDRRDFPFLDVYLEEQEDPEVLVNKCFPVRKVRASMKGLMVFSDDFMIFVFKSNPTYAFLLEALGKWVKGDSVNQLVILVQSTVGDYDLGMDDEGKAVWKHGSDKKTYLCSDPKDTGKSQKSTLLKNPFL